jgi:uncharacterized protein YndB with AHSA1/START domain
MYARPRRATTTTGAGALAVPATSVSRLIHASQNEVWSLLSDIERANRWNRAWTSIRFTSAQTHGAGTTFRAVSDSGEPFDFEICDWSAPERIAFCPIRAEDERYAITLDSHIFEVRAVGPAESEVTITANASARGLRGRFVAAFFWKNHQNEGLNLALDAVQAVFEPDALADRRPAAQPETTIEE